MNARSRQWRANVMGKGSEIMYSMIYITAKNSGEARKIADKLLEERLVACASMFPVRSSFWWKGKIEKSSETAVICKTKSMLAGKVIKKVKESHSYEVPEVVEIPIKSGNKDFLEWIGEVTK